MRELADLGFPILELEGLHHIGVGAGPVAIVDVARMRRGRQHDDRNRAFGIAGAEFPKQPAAIDTWQIEIEHDERGPLGKRAIGLREQTVHGGPPALAALERDW